jgi:hypothetical protein
MRQNDLGVPIWGKFRGAQTYPKNETMASPISLIGVSLLEVVED